MPAKGNPRAAPPSADAKGLSLHAADEGDAKDIQLLVDAHKLKGHIRVIFHTGQHDITEDEVMAFLVKLNARVTEAGRAAIADAVAKSAEASGVIGPLLVAEGRAPVAGTDGRIEWQVNPPEPVRGHKTGKGRVDYRERNQIVNVRKGQKILTIVEPPPGEAGEDVFGNVIPFQAGHAVTVHRGKNVEAAPDGKEFLASVTGMLQYSGETVSVEPSFIVQNNVDMSVGNINFIGPVKVGRDVGDGFVIRAGKEIEIGGMVEGSILESASYIRIGGGVAGKGRGRIICKGNLEARYLSEVFVETGGDVTVNNSITTSSVKSLGKIIVNNGGIRGANVVAQKGLRAPEIGSDLGIRTVVVVGVDYHVKDKLVTLERELGVIREAVEKIEKALGPLLTDGDIVATLPPEKAEIARRLMAQLDVLMKRAPELGARRDALFAKMQVGSDMAIEVSKKIYAGVVMQIGTCRRTFELDVNGPMKLLPDIESGSIKVSR